MHYYVPRTKSEVIKFFVIKMGYSACDLRKMAKKQLLAIYHRVMRERITTNYTLSS